MQQEQLLDLLVSGEQVAFHAVGQQLQGLAPGVHVVTAHAHIDPARQLTQAHRPDRHTDTGLFQRLYPLAAARGRLQLAGDNQQHGVFRRTFGIVAQYLGALPPRLAGGQAQLHQALLGKQGKAVTCRQQAVPVEPGLDAEHLAVGEALGTGRGAHRVGTLVDQQCFITVDEVNRRQPLAKLRF